MHVIGLEDQRGS